MVLERGMGGLRVALASDGSDHALAAAAWVAEHLDAQAAVTVLTVVEDPLHQLDATLPLLPRPSRRPVPNTEEWALAQARRTARVLDRFACGIRILHGDAVREILRDVRTHAPHLLVVGHRGHTGPEGLAMGTVAQALVRFSEVPVLAIPAATQPMTATSSPLGHLQP